MLTTDLADILKPETNGPLLIITVGNSLRSDDGVAPYIAAQVRRPKDGVVILDAGDRPENIVWKATEVAPRRIVIIDAADFGGEPGEIRVIPEDCLPENLISTHRFPLRAISHIVAEDTGATVDFLCIQPESVAFGESLSDRVRTSAREIAELLGDAG